MLFTHTHINPKDKIHKELKLRYREFFESKLAVDILDSPKIFASVKMISDHIIKLINEHKTIIAEIITKHPEHISELCEPFFGSCYSMTEGGDANNIIECIVRTLDANNDLKKSLQIHCYFSHRIYPTLEPKLPPLLDTLFKTQVLSKENRGRFGMNRSATPTTQLGIAHNKVFAKRVGQSSTKHLRALDAFLINNQTRFFKKARKKGLPTVTGPSGHAASLLMSAKLLANLNEEALKEYALIVFAFLTAGGHHSYEETRVVARLLGLIHQQGNYLISLPLSFRNSIQFKNLSAIFPEFLDEENHLTPKVNSK